MVKYLKYIEKAFFIREFEKLLLNLFNKGLLNGTVHTCIGQELIPVILVDLLDVKYKIFSNHRGHGHYISAGGDHLALLAELMGKREGASGGIGGSQHIFSDNFISNGIQGGLVPVSLGYSFVNKLNGDSSISVTFIGDGTLGQGVVYESLNLASLLSTPTLFVLENNQYAQSTSLKETLAGSVEERVDGFSIKYYSSNIWDLEDLIEKMNLSISLVKSGMPVFLEINCYRLNSHSKGDDNRFDKEIEEFKNKDLLNQFQLNYPDEFNKIQYEISNTLSNSLEICLGMDDLDTVESFSPLYEKECQYLDCQNINRDSNDRINKLIYEGLKSILATNNALIIGEDIKYYSPFTEKPYGGAFKVTNDLSELFPGRLINSPISESAIVGFGIGAALNGCVSIVEIMFGDFLTLALDQIFQQASKIPSMYSQSIKLPLIIRTPMGARRGYGPTHSQNLEKLVFFLPNVRVIALNSVFSPSMVYQNLANVDKPTIVIEDKVGYTKFLNANDIKGFEISVTDDIFPTVLLKPNFSKPNCLIILYGGMLDEILVAINELIENDIFPCVICPTQLTPLNLYPIVDMMKYTNKLIFIEEGSKFGGISSEIISYLVEKKIKFELLGRISNESIIPCSKKAELSVVPNSSNILSSLIKLIQ
jgi:2-oxoisovalerate dehydrogenase E1 component